MNPLLSHPLLRSSPWWAAGTACCAAPVAASIWTPNRSTFFYPALALMTLTGALVGPAWARRSRTPAGAALLVSSAYPIALTAAVGIQAIEDEGAWAAAAVVVIVGAAVGGIAPALRHVTAEPGRALRWGSTVWAIVSIITIPVLGLGLFGIPQVVSYRLAARLTVESLRAG